MDVLVNSTNCGLDLSRGMVSRTIKELAGNQVQDDCRRHHPDGIELGQVIKTSSGNLRSCKAIFHGALQQYSKSNPQKCIFVCVYIYNILFLF